MNEALPTHDVFLSIFDQAPTQELSAGEVLINAGAPAKQV
jgi:hypothetical protein